MSEVSDVRSVSSPSGNDDRVVVGRVALGGHRHRKSFDRRLRRRQHVAESAHQGHVDLVATKRFDGGVVVGPDEDFGLHFQRLADLIHHLLRLSDNRAGILGGNDPDLENAGFGKSIAGAAPVYWFRRTPGPHRSKISKPVKATHSSPPEELILLKT